MVKMQLLGGAAIFAALFSIPSGAEANIGPDAGVCASGNGPAALVRVVGLKNRAGKVRVRTFDGTNPKAWFDKKRALKRTEVAIPGSGAVEICMPVPKAGSYVIDLRHDTNGNGDSDRADGAGATGNPSISLFDFLLGKKPPASKVVVQVGNGITPISITMKYLQGGSFKPVQTAAR
jgi:uncharacterized protein (DUF2141 family)